MFIKSPLNPSQPIENTPYGSTRGIDSPKKLQPSTALLVSSHTNIFYLTGFKGLAENEREAWVVFIGNPDSNNSKTYLLTDGRYFHAIQKKNAHNNSAEIVPMLISAEQPFREVLKQIIEQEKITMLQFEAENLTYDEFARLSFIGSDPVQGRTFQATTGLISKLRERKKPSEIEAIRKACTATDQCFAEIVRHIEQHLKQLISQHEEQHIQLSQAEKEIANSIETWIKNHGYGMAFYPIVAINAHAAIPHYDTRGNGSEPVERNLSGNDSGRLDDSERVGGEPDNGIMRAENGSIILIDFGIKVDGYYSDMTRMVAVGKPSEEFTKAYETLRKAQEQAIQQLDIIINYSEVDKATREFVVNAGYPTYEHSTGHGVGLDIHEAPRISTHSTETKQPGHVITIEPGIYIKEKFGVRIEDTVLIKDDGSAEVLTRSSKELEII